jgi:hypothetical protein
MSAKLLKNWSTRASMVKPSCPNSSDEKSTPEMPSFRLRNRIAPIANPIATASARIASPLATDPPHPDIAASLGFVVVNLAPAHLSW